MKLKANLLGGSIFLILSIILWLLIPNQISVSGNAIITSQTFPRLIVILMFLGSMVLLLGDIIKLVNKKPVLEVRINPKEEIRAIIACFMLIAYAFLLSKIGFLFSSVLYCCSMLIFFKSRNIKYYISVIIVCIAVTYIFKYILLVQLP